MLGVTDPLGRDRRLRAQLAAQLADDGPALVEVQVLPDQRRAAAVAAARALRGQLVDAEPQQMALEVGGGAPGLAGAIV